LIPSRQGGGRSRHDAVAGCDAENFDVFDLALTPEEITAIDALDTGIRGGPDPELINTELYPFKVEN
jgi:hypothetical protein